MTFNTENTPALVPNTHELQCYMTIAKQCNGSGFYRSIGDEAKLMAIILSARELGIPPMTALNGGLWNIQGKIEMSARLMSSMIRRAGHSIKVLKSDVNGCTLEGKRADNGDTMTCSFTMEDAQRAGLAGKTNWKNYPEDQCYARALSRLARRLFPDVIGNCYIEGEIRECIKPESLPESNDVQIIEDPPEQAELIEQFLLQFGEDKDNFKKYMELVLKHYDTLTPTTFIEEFEKNKQEKMSNFSKWKEKHAA